MKTKLSIFISIAMLAGCASLTPAEQSKLDTANKVGIAIEPLVVTVADLGLGVSGAGEFIPVTNAGLSSLVALQNSYAAKTGITPDAAAKITKAADLGLQITGSGSVVPKVDAVSADIQLGLAAAQAASSVK